MTRRTKIVATIGPASSNKEMISALLDAGVNVFRLNFSHGDAETHSQTAALIRQLCEEKGNYAAILGDLQGPKIRLGDIPNGKVTIEEEQEIILSIDLENAENNGWIPVGYQPLPESVEQDDILLLDDGLMRVKVNKVDGQNVHCQVINGGELKSRKGINRLGGGLSAPAITEKDHKDIDLAVKLKLDYLAVSFPSNADDLKPIREQLTQLESPIRIISKIERAEAVANEQVLSELILASDGVMVARGDLGVEIGDPQLIGVQKKIISMARKLDRPVITATQMMESMISSPVPTRAEVFDVANAVLDKTDAVMLSAETAVGAHPHKVVAAMADACVGAEKQPLTQQSTYRVDRKFSRIDQMTAMSAIYAANHTDDIGAIVCLTESGSTALYASRLSTGLPIFGISRSQEACRRMSLYRGVIPLYANITGMTIPDAIDYAMQCVQETGKLKKGQRVCMTYGAISGKVGLTNTLKIIELEN